MLSVVAPGCRRGCLADFEQRAEELKAFHEELAALSPEVQDVHLPWIFQKGARAIVRQSTRQVR